MQKTIWNKNTVAQLFDLTFLELIFKAQNFHREHFNPNEIELCTLLSIKTGTCPEDCAYCPQSGHYKTGLQKESLLDVEEVIANATQAKENGAIRFCMGAAWRNPSAKDFPKVVDMIKQVKALGLETCVTLGMLTAEQAQQLKEVGLDFYNHNLDTSPEFYQKITSTRTYQDRLDTLEHVRNSGINVCCGGIMGMGESRVDRIEFLLQLANLPKPPESVPINRLVPVAGTPLGETPPLDNFEFIRTIAVARIMMPSARIRLSAGRESMSEEMQALCFMAGANSIWLGNKLLTVANKEKDQDWQMFEKFGLHAKKQVASDSYTASE